MNKYIKQYIYIWALTLCAIMSGCDDVADEITSLDVSRLFSPVNLGVTVVNKVDARLMWKPMSGAEEFVVEIYDNGEENYSGTPVRTITGIKSEDLPYTVTKLDGETSYSVRVKAISSEIAESKWISATFKTDAEQIFYAVALEDIAATSVILRWPEGEVATQIMLSPGDIVYNITPDDIAAGTATINNLAPETEYKATMMNGTKTRGTAKFTTPLDLGGAIVVDSEDDFSAMIESAKDGDVFALMPGIYNLNKKLSIKNSISIVGAKPSDRPELHALLSLEEGISFELKNVILDGTSVGTDGVNGDQAVQFNTAGVVYGKISIEGCEIKNWLKGLLYFNQASTAGSITFNNCVIYNIECNGGDFFDCRLGGANTVIFTNNTVYNSALSRDLFRIDNPGTFPEVQPVIRVENNTFYNVCNGTSRRILYIRWAGNQVYFNKNIISNTDGYYTNQSATNIVEMLQNNYYKAPNFLASETASAKNDVSGTSTGFDPGFADPSTGNFTISNETLIYGQIGDPRWIK